MSEQEPYTPSDDEVMTDYLNMQSLIADERDIDANYQAVLRWGRWLAAHDAEVTRAAAEKAMREAVQIVEDTARQGGGLQTAATAISREANRIGADR